MTRHTITVSGERRAYYVEESKRKAKNTAFFFHGSTQPVSGFRTMTGITSPLQYTRCVWLDGRISAALTDGNRRGWASSPEMEDALRLVVNSDLNFFEAVRAKFPQAQNDWLVGYSNGFDMAATLGMIYGMNVFGAAFCPVNLPHCTRRVEHHHGWQDVHAPFHGGQSHTLDYEHLSVLDTWAGILGIAPSGVMRNLMMDGYCGYGTRHLTMHAANHFTIWDYCRDDLRAAVQEG